jgi:hypothetical protein
MARGCVPVIKGGCDCPSRYECPSERLQRLQNNTNGLYILNTFSLKILKCLYNCDKILGNI